MSAIPTATLSLHGLANEIVLQGGKTFLTFGELRVDAKQLVQLAPEQAADTFLKVEAVLLDGAWIATSVTPLRRAGPTPPAAPAQTATSTPSRQAMQQQPASGAAAQRGSAPAGFGRPALVTSAQRPASAPAAARAASSPAPSPAPAPQRAVGGSPFAGLMGSRPAAAPAAASAKSPTRSRPAFNPNTVDDLDDDIPF